MAKVICADVSCKHLSDDGECMARKIDLSWSSVVTLWNGRQEYNTCRTKEESEEYRAIKEIVNKVLEERNDSD